MKKTWLRRLGISVCSVIPGFLANQNDHQAIGQGTSTAENLRTEKVTTALAGA